MLPDKVDNIADVRRDSQGDVVVARSNPVEDALSNLPLDAPFREDVVHLPIENEVDIRVEAEVARIAKDLRATGYEMYIKGASLPAIAKQLGTTIRVINCWARDGQWAERLHKMNDVLEGVVREGVRFVRLGRAEQEMEESLNLGRKIRRRVDAALGEEDDGRKFSAQELKALGEAAKSTVDIGNRGMGESQATPQNDKVGARPLVMVFNGNGGLPPIKVVRDAE